MNFAPTPLDWSPTKIEYGKRQQSGSNPPPSESTNNNGTQPSTNPNSQGAPPLSVFTFIIAIALFVLVVSFVLLRIFVRNRRLRRLGIYPESPIERLLGGAPKEYEDNLPPPKLWDAKIADISAHNQGALAKAEKSWLGGGVGAGEVKDHGWDALMPVAAALPPSLYPIIYAQDAANAANAGNTTLAPTGPNSAAALGAGRFGRRMPNFLRRSTNEATTEADAEADNGASANAQADTGEAAGNTQTNNTAEKQNTETGNKDEKLSASVNITVLIAMPSPSTVFPTVHKPNNNSVASLRHSQSRLGNGSATMLPSTSKIDEVQEDADMDALSDKGKAKRAPSLRSVRSVSTIKSLADARREAFFGGAAQRSSIDNEAAQKPQEQEPAPAPQNAYDDDEEEELPELVFGTASVPLYSKIVSGKQSQGVPSTLISPTKEEILTLMSTVAEARTRKVQPAAKADQKSEEAENNRRSVAGTSLDGGMSNLEEQNGLGDVVSRMMRTNNGMQSSTEAYEMDTMRRANNAETSVNAGTPDARPSTSTQEGLMMRAAPMGRDDQLTPMETPLSANERQPLYAATTPSLQTPGIASDQGPLVTSDSMASANFADARSPTYSSSLHTAEGSVHSFHTTNGGREQHA
ncbi:uncharacterized protein FA14DRAFT_174505 [Meira miltonrushii]|uniref:Uncharacterized protein n=1 Tax=Meira miltonrushii TaxID=1280837 RepID=A0A316V5K2_9BASI|nr:uncharacterized protein FA14DRAFT_174505 [Meira miltonrushii]PWN32830.1 hypothetical protein FA14DRAFT_174505 [Meira miltonrushii]